MIARGAASSGVALANVLIPVVIKSSFPARVGLLTGIYTSALQAGGAFGAAVTPAVEHSVGGWRRGNCLVAARRGWRRGGNLHSAASKQRQQHQ